MLVVRDAMRGSVDSGCPAVVASTADRAARAHEAEADTAKPRGLNVGVHDADTDRVHGDAVHDAETIRQARLKRWQALPVDRTRGSRAL